MPMWVKKYPVNDAPMKTMPIAQPSYRGYESLPGKSVCDDEHCRRIEEHEGYQCLGRGEPEGGVSCLERIGAGNASPGIGRQRHRRGDICQHAVVKDEEVGDNGSNSEKPQGGGSDRNQDDIGCRGRYPGTENYTGDGGKDQGQKKGDAS